MEKDWQSRDRLTSYIGRNKTKLVDRGWRRGKPTRYIERVKIRLADREAGGETASHAT